MCTSCTDPNKSVMDYRNSDWIDNTHPKYGQVICEPRTLVIDGFYTRSIDNVFQKCSPNCKTCNDGLGCDVCDNPNDNFNYYLLISVTPNYCVRCLTENSRFVNPAGKCEDCPSTCSKCTSQTVCTECKADNYILSLAATGMCEACPTTGYEVKDGKCLRVCPDGQYRTTRNQCLPCPESYCAKCAAETGVCTDCDATFKLRDDNKQCWKDCGDRKYAKTQTTCEDCAEFCKQCAIETGHCEICNDGFTEDTATNLCWKDCQPREFNPSQGVCNNCPLHCSACSRVQGICNPCDNGHTFDAPNNLCWKDCLSNQFNPDVSNCQNCPITAHSVQGFMECALNANQVTPKTRTISVGRIV